MSAGSVAPSRFTRPRLSEPSKKWMWQSTKPGRTSWPRASITLTPGWRHFSISASSPTATILPARMATACPQGCLALTVYTLPCTTSMSAGGMSADCAKAGKATAEKAAKARTPAAVVPIFMVPSRAKQTPQPSFTNRTLECRRRVDPQQARFGPARISPAMRHGTLEIQAVAGLQPVVFLVAQPDFEFSTQDMQELFALVGVRLAAPAFGLHTEEVR